MYCRNQGKDKKVSGPQKYRRKEYLWLWQLSSQKRGENSLLDIYKDDLILGRTEGKEAALQKKIAI